MRYTSKVRHGMVRARVEVLFSNFLVVAAGLAFLVGFTYASNSLDPNRALVRVIEAFDDGTLSDEWERTLVPVTGFLVMESDSNGSCGMYSQMLSPKDALFGLGLRDPENRNLCESLRDAIREPAEEIYDPYYRYWHGGAAVSRVALTLTSVFWWQVILTTVLVLLIISLSARIWRYSRTLALGLGVVTCIVIDFPWQGLSPLHGLSSIVGMLFAHLTLSSFALRWRVRWGVVVLGGLFYASMAHTLIPMAFTMLTSLVAMTPLLTRRPQPTASNFWVGSFAGVAWIFGYVLAMGSRFLWVGFLGPGWQVAVDEWMGGGGSFLIRSWADPFYQTLGLLMKTWFDVGFMQIGLFIFAMIFGWSLAKGGAAFWRSKCAWIALCPALFGLVWMTVWAWHTNHTFVHAVPGVLLLIALFSSEVARATFRNVKVIA